MSSRHAATAMPGTHQDGAAPLSESDADIEADFEILETIGGIYEGLAEKVVRAGAPHKTLRRWVVGHRDGPDEEDEQIALMAMAVDLEIFTPSMSGKTALDRHLDGKRPQNEREVQAFRALRGAQFHLVTIEGRDGPDQVRLLDLATLKELVLLDSRLSPLAEGGATAMRLCPLASDRHVLISPLFVIDDATLETAMGFVKPGKPLGNGYRCAANLYRDVARQDFMPMPLLTDSDEDVSFDEAELSEALSPDRYLAARWITATTGEERDELTAKIRQIASLDTLVDALGTLGRALADAPEVVVQAFTHVAEIQIETIARRARAGVSGFEDILDRAAVTIAAHVTAGTMVSEAKTTFDRLRARHAFAGSTSRKTDQSPDGSELDKVIQRIRALRAKTVDQGCTEEEAMAAAAKVAELLDRYDLSLDEISVRQSDCVGTAVATNRRRRAPIDDCIPPVANFCDCRVWLEENDGEGLRYIFFGLKADVEAARFLHDLIEATFETESAAFRQGAIYGELRGGDRRSALNSFQIGLARGIVTKLDTLKAARMAATGIQTTGFDLVAVKHSVVDDEMEKLGLRFTTKSSSARRLVMTDAYEAGQAAGAQFEPHRLVR
jgi:hypothetical protein